jgi:hypothetical protein
LGDPGTGDTAFVGIGLCPARDQEAGFAEIQIGSIRRVCSPRITGLVNADLLARAPTFAAETRPDRWLAGVLAAKPADVSLAEWAAACAVRRLASGPRTAVGHACIDCVSAGPVATALAPADRLALLDELSALADYRKRWTDTDAGIDDYFGTLMRRRKAEASRAERDGLPVAAETWRRSQMWAPHNGRDALPAIDRQFLRDQVFAATAAGRSAETVELIRRTQFFVGSNDKMEEALPSVRWLMAEAAAGAGDRALAMKYPLLPEWRELVLADYSKKVFNAQAELATALRDQDDRAVCAVLTRLQGTMLDGLAPSMDDPRLARSFLALLDAAFARRPELQTVRREEFGPRGLLRVREAMGRGDRDAVALAAVQFYGTEASGLAEQWLGDVAMAEGRFGRARCSLPHCRPVPVRQRPQPGLSPSPIGRIADRHRRRRTGHVVRYLRRFHVFPPRL